MALRTPRHTPRNLDASPHGLAGLSNPFPSPSPYTPSHRRSSVFTATPQLIPPPQTTAAPEPVEEAEHYVATDLRDALRNASVDALATLTTTAFQRTDATHAADYLIQLCDVLSSQLARSDALSAAPAIRPATRRQLSTLNAHLRLEHAVWHLVDAAWRRATDPPCDALTARLRLPPRESDLLSAVRGVTKVQHVLAWLESTASSALARAGGPQLKPLDDPAYRWEYTKARCATEPVSIDFQTSSEGSLEEVERKAETRLAREIFRMVRAGQIEAAAEICRQAGQSWRAAALQGGKGAADLSSNGQKGLARRMWRTAAAATAMSDNTVVPKHERAVCAVLSGVLEPILAVCETYEDQAWARLSIKLDEAVQSVFEDLTSAEIDDDSILQIFEECNSGHGTDTDISPDLLVGIRKIQSYIALGPGISDSHFNVLMTALRTVSEEASRNRIEWVARLCAEVCLFIKLSGAFQGGEEHAHAIAEFDLTLLRYVHLIVQLDLEEERKAVVEGEILPPRPTVYTTAASFLAHVSAEQEVTRSYAMILVAALRGDLTHEKFESERAGASSMKIEERRVRCLQIAEHYFSPELLQGMLIEAVREVWEDTFLAYEPGPAPSRESLHFTQAAAELMEIDKEEETIRSIELLVYPGFCNYEETLRCANHAARRFFLQESKEAARKVVLWLPREILDVVPKSCGGLIREFKCWNAYMGAVAKYGEWHTFFNHMKPDPIPDSIRHTAQQPSDMVGFKNRTTAVDALSEYEAAMRNFHQKLTPLIDDAVQALQDALLFGGGWMGNVDSGTYSDESDADASRVEIRREEIKRVRFEGTPQLAMLLHHILHKSEKYKDAMNLAVLVAGEDFKLYQSFSPGDMRTLLAKIAESSVLEADHSVKAGATTRPYKGTFFEEFPPGSGEAPDSARMN